MSLCYFNGCNKPALPSSWRCLFHRNRGRCLVTDCHNQVYARKLCAKHGGKKQCAFAGCEMSARLANVCYRHGAGGLKKRCVHPGCSKPAQLRQRCVRHGGGRKCKVGGCDTHARSGGYCSKHGRELQDLLTRQGDTKDFNAAAWEESSLTLMLEPLKLEKVDFSLSSVQELRPWTNDLVELVMRL
ncbi:unnamed protein product [Aphanomyces euteiches]|uniref:WRKY19-like zinc finger domain-containing protein n=1 Tax=Aphanomyces euteiches TaxID=100861 RepID=A0A6G0WTB5_9STRA|nr:hypothetical protein Ae201684_011905 [Aphanomyces euteiches]KAH9089351.1 hypothetical protein Ae201684P_001551 [Aphanomyces euteiches]KAH9145445.1 hypothetical protein AeRB84_010647 [Aphanomyces euteiches]